MYWKWQVLTLYSFFIGFSSDINHMVKTIMVWPINFYFAKERSVTGATPNLSLYNKIWKNIVLRSSAKDYNCNLCNPLREENVKATLTVFHPSSTIQPNCSVHFRNERSACCDVNQVSLLFQHTHAFIVYIHGIYVYILRV